MAQQPGDFQTQGFYIVINPRMKLILENGDVSVLQNKMQNLNVFIWKLDTTHGIKLISWIFLMKMLNSTKVFQGTHKQAIKH